MAIHAKQINKILSAPIRVSAFSATGGSSVVTSAITTALSTAGNGGVSVPLQVSSAIDVMGLITSSPHNRVEIYSATPDDKIKDSNGDEVFARLTEAAGVYTLTYYTLPDSGTETAYTFSGSTSVDFEVNYRFDFDRFPADGAIAISTRNVSQDPASNGGGLYSEKLTVTAQNTIAALAKTPTNTGNVELIINEVSYNTFGGGSAHFSVTGKTISWSASNSGFNVETTDSVIARYTTNE
jgi:hypothetical protein